MAIKSYQISIQCQQELYDKFKNIQTQELHPSIPILITNEERLAQKLFGFRVSTSWGKPLVLFANILFYNPKAYENDKFYTLVENDIATKAISPSIRIPKKTGLTSNDLKTGSFKIFVEFSYTRILTVDGPRWLLRPSLMITEEISYEDANSEVEILPEKIIIDQSIEIPIPAVFLEPEIFPFESTREFIKEHKI